MSASDGYSTDDCNRKREREDDSPFSRRSKKTARTPERNPKTTDMEELKSMMAQLMAEFTEMRKANEDYKKEVRDLRRENQDLKAEVSLIKEKVKHLENLEWKIEKQEREAKKNNIIITGLKLERLEGPALTKAVEDLLKLHLKVTPKFLWVKKMNDERCICGLENFGNKLEIMKSKQKLKMVKDRKIFIMDDLTYNEREIQRKIRERASQEKARNAKVKIGYQYLIIDDQKWKWSPATQKLEKVNGEERQGTSKN